MNDRPRLARLTGALVAAVATIALGVAPAHAATSTATSGAQTRHGTFTEADEGDDPDTCAAFGFSFHVVVSVTYTFNLLVDSSGDFVRGFVHHDQAVTFTGPTGKTIYESDHFNESFFPDGTSTLTGNSQRNYATNGVLLRDAGRIVFDASGNPASVAGPHPFQIDGATFCPFLAPEGSSH